jgi:flagellum-specific peptidoglycan hydrolase FlgJ
MDKKMNISKIVKIANKLDNNNQFKLADKFTSYLSRYADLVETMIDEALQSAQQFQYNPKDTGLSIERPVVEQNKNTKSKPNVDAFLKKYGPAAQASSEIIDSKSGKKYYLPPSVILAMAAQESGWSPSALGEKGNLFGIKAGPTSGSSESVKMPTSEYDESGRKYNTDAEFAVFDKDPNVAISRLINFLKNNPRYSGVFKASEEYKNAKSSSALESVVNAIFTAGYSTHKDEPGEVMDIINSNNLTRFD